MSFLELRRVSKVYGEGAAEVQALREVSLSVDAGVVSSGDGTSGSGKSTLLTIAGSLDVAYLAAASFFRSQLTERMSHPPTLDLVLVLIRLPVAAAVGGWIFAGRQPVAISHQRIE